MSGRASDGRAQSVKQRLLNLSKARGETFHMLLMRYGVERLLYRLSRTTHADSFVLKGAMLYRDLGGEASPAHAGCRSAGARGAIHRASGASVPRGLRRCGGAGRDDVRSRFGGGAADPRGQRL